MHVMWYMCNNGSLATSACETFHHKPQPCVLRCSKSTRISPFPWCLFRVTSPVNFCPGLRPLAKPCNGWMDSKLKPKVFLEAAATRRKSTCPPCCSHRVAPNAHKIPQGESEHPKLNIPTVRLFCSYLGSACSPTARYACITTHQQTLGVWCRLVDTAAPIAEGICQRRCAKIRGKGCCLSLQNGVITGSQSTTGYFQLWHSHVLIFAGEVTKCIYFLDTWHLTFCRQDFSGSFLLYLLGKRDSMSVEQENLKSNLNLNLLQPEARDTIQYQQSIQIRLQTHSTFPQ